MAARAEQALEAALHVQEPKVGLVDRRPDHARDSEPAAEDHRGPAGA
jgi:hypothetical protein